MKHVACFALAALTTLSSFCQTDSTKKEPESDTLKVGNFIIIKKKDNKIANNTNQNIDATINVTFDKTKPKNPNSRLKTNWLIFDLGFANYNDQTNYAAAQASGYLRQINGSTPVDANSFSLNAAKSSNVNIWAFMQKFNITKHMLNLKYGIGLEMYNFRFEHNVSYRKDPVPFVFNDSISFSKNKLYVGYITVPFMLNFNPTPNKKGGFSVSAGVSAGYLVGSHSKQISGERGKQKFESNFNLNPWRLAAVGELGIGPIRLYGSYSLNTLHKASTGLEQTPYAVGIRFSNW